MKILENIYTGFKSQLSAQSGSLRKLGWKSSIYYLKMAHLRLFYGQRFESHTFQVIFNPLKGPKAAIIQKSIKIYLKDYSREVSAKNRIYFLRGFQSLCGGGTWQGFQTSSSLGLSWLWLDTLRKKPSQFVTRLTQTIECKFFLSNFEMPIEAI